MAEDEPGTSLVSGLVQEFTARLRGAAEGLEGLAGFVGHLSSSPGALPLPGSLSAAQLKSIADAIAAQRRSIEALKAQLSSFDEQLAVLERILGPLTEWSGTWADLERKLVSLGRREQLPDQPGTQPPTQPGEQGH